MGKMKELYKKVAGDKDLQAKFAEIMKDAAEAGEETKGKLIAFAKDAGYDVSLDEMKEFFKDMAERSRDELSDAELNAVAGGKTGAGIAFSVISLGAGCALASAVIMIYGEENYDMTCSDFYNI